MASAPNAKGLFSLGSSSKSTTKNGFLAPVDQGGRQASGMKSIGSQSSLEGGNDSLDTISSGSSRGYGTRKSKSKAGRKWGGSLTPPKTAPLGRDVRERLKSAPAPPDRSIAFRRTYSSNSIKVRQVSICLRSSQVGEGRERNERAVLTNRVFGIGGGGPVKFPEDQDARQRGCRESISGAGKEVK